MRIRALRLGVALALATLGACQDGEKRAAPGQDADAGRRGTAHSRACQDCVMEGRVESRAAYAACVANVKCNRMILCEFERGCLATATRDQQCLQICSKEAGIRALTDPALQLASRLNVTASAHCSGACAAR